MNRIAILEGYTNPFKKGKTRGTKMAKLGKCAKRCKGKTKGKFKKCVRKCMRSKR